MSNVWLDVNLLLFCAKEAYANDNVSDALAVYLLLADGDPSLDGGFTGFQIARCYEKAGDLFSAKYWAGRAVEENPGIEEYVKYRNSFDNLSLEGIIDRYREGYSDQFGLSKKQRERALREGREVWPP